MKNDEVKELLKSNGALCVDMYEAFVRGEPETIFADSDTVYIHHPCGVNMLWTNNEDACKKMLKEYERPFICVSHGDKARTSFTSVYNCGYGDPCYQYTKLDRKLLDVKKCADELRLADLSEAEFIHSIYNPSGHIEHIIDTINRHELYCAIVDGNIAGFVGTHDDGSIGMLEVLPPYRRRGIATELEFTQMNRHISMGYTPYGQVYTYNANSVYLQKKAGLDVAEETISWNVDKDRI